MPSKAAPTSHALPPRSAPRVAEVMRATAALFERTHPAVETRSAILWWVALLTLAGAGVRLYGLGAVGLHGDEETMALAVHGILDRGLPILPSGMFYPRGLMQLYLMAASISLFGESEWALRLPSVLCGVAMIPLAYVIGRRFLTPAWNLGFTAVVAFLPELLVYSQTARMYIFLIAFVMASLACLFAWERTQRDRWLVGAAAFLMLGLDMHALAVAAILMLLFPGLLHGDLRRLWRGAAAAAIVFVCYVLFHSWVEGQYPTPPAEFVDEIGATVNEHVRAPRDFAFLLDVVLWTSGLFVLGLLLFGVARTVRGRLASLAAGILLLAGVALQLGLFYHVAALCYVAGAAIALRFGDASTVRRLLWFGGALAIIAVVHAILLAPQAGTPIRLVGALVGEPSPWPYVRLAELSAIAGVLAGALLLWGVWRIARREPVGDFWLLAVLGVWAPTFALGAFAWNIPSRYTSISLIPMLLCAFAFAQHLWRRRPSAAPAHSTGAMGAVLIALITIASIQPLAALEAVAGGYSVRPDHKGAAEFMRSVGMTADDIVLAEDVLQQTYYLGEVDYWLVGPRVARRFVKRTADGVVDFYTGTPVIATQEMLDEVLEHNPGKRIFVIGSGEDQSNGRRVVRGPELYAALNSPRFETIYTGRDGLTQVLRPASAAAASSRTRQAASRREAQSSEAESSQLQQPRRVEGAQGRAVQTDSAAMQPE